MNAAWKGGISFEPYPVTWTKELRDAIRLRDGELCQECGEVCSTGRALCVHHINYNKEDLRPTNLIALCARCHGKTNFKRDEWQAKYESLMRERFGEDGAPHVA